MIERLMDVRNIIQQDRSMRTLIQFVAISGGILIAQSVWRFLKERVSAEQLQPASTHEYDDYLGI